MAADQPAVLALSDIVHVRSPSPVPAPLHPRSPTPDQDGVPEPETHKMFLRIVEMGLSGEESVNASSREKELADMVLRLTAFAKPDTNQLLRQADTISGLTSQRNYLIQQVEEERTRWESEKDGWARMAEALISLRNKDGHSAAKDEELERQVLSFESDNKILREKLTDTQARLTALESELSKLRPLLLMQPYATTHSHPIAINTTNARTKSPRKRKPVPPTPTTTIDEEPAEDSRNVSSPNKDHYRRQEKSHPNTSTPRKRTQKSGPKQPLLTDARTEHLLLAARKIGRERAGIISGLLDVKQKAEQGRKDEEGSAAAAGTLTSGPKTPRRAAPGQQQGTPQFVYMNSPIRGQNSPNPAVPMLVPYHMIPRTPGASTSAAVTSSSVSPQKPHTPGLDSLLSAARSIDMMNSGDQPSSGGVNGTRRTRGGSSAIDELDGSPVPKRRKTGNAGSSGSLGRVKSALDVLADQAAVFSSKETGKGKGKGKDKSDGSPVRADSESGSPRGGRTRGRGKSRRGKVKSGTERSVSPVTAAESPRRLRSSPRIRRESRDSQGLWSNALGSRGTVGSSPAGGGDMAPVSPSGDVFMVPTPVDGGAQDEGITPRQSKDSFPFSAGHWMSPSPPRHGGSSILAPPILLSRSHSEEIIGHRDYDSPPGSPLGNSPGNTRRATSIPPRHTGALDDEDVTSDFRLDVGGKEMQLRMGLVGLQPVMRQRSPYVKWTKEEDDLLAQAVAQYGQKWDMVQKALPSRGYHQVRQRWLRKIGMFDPKADLSAFHIGNSILGESEGTTAPDERRPNPKLGMAPLSSEIGHSTGASQS